MCTQSRRKGARLKRNVITDDGKEKGEKMGEGNTPTFLDIFMWEKMERKVNLLTNCLALWFKKRSNFHAGINLKGFRTNSSLETFFTLGDLRTFVRENLSVNRIFLVDIFILSVLWTQWYKLFALYIFITVFQRVTHEIKILLLLLLF